MEKEEALAVGFANLKGGKDKDIPSTAFALQTLRNLPEYNSNTKVGKIFDVSGEIIREFLLYFKLPKGIQQLFVTGQLKQLEQLRRLGQIGHNKPELLNQVANGIQDLKSHDGRYVVEYILRHPGISPKEAKEIILNSKTKTKREYFIMAKLDKEQYDVLLKESKKKKVSRNRLISEIIQNWVEARK